MIFSELYSVYYSTVSKILCKALEGNTSEKELQQQVIKNAFSESSLAILPSLKSGKWQLMRSDLSPVIHHKPSLPLTVLEKRWLKSLTDDPRIKLFNVTFPDLKDIQPLFTREDYKVYDKYSDGDMFDDEAYIRHFRILRHAIDKKRAVQITMLNRRGEKTMMRFIPQGFEYSVKDDKIRVLASKCRYRYFNLGRIIECEPYTGERIPNYRPKKDNKKCITMHITDERNALQRIMLHFAHFEKQAERIDSKHYILNLKYYESDETELVIRILSFGPHVKVTAPESFVTLIKKRLIDQKNCEMK